MAKVKRVSHIGIVVRDLDAASKLWSEAYGFQEFRRMDIPAEGIRSAFLSPGGTGDEMFIELMQPADPDDTSNAVARRLARSGEGFYHVALWMDDVEESGRDLEARGMTVLRRDPAVEGDEPRFVVHPRDSNGVLVEGIRSRWISGGES
jgi:methylmalonyl-CoA epimerase